MNRQRSHSRGYRRNIDAARAVYADQGLRNGRVFVRPSVRLSVCPIDRQQQRRAAGLLLSAVRLKA